MTIQELKTGIFLRLSRDVTLKRLMGGTLNDPRVYWYYNGDALITDDKPAFLTYSLIARGEQAGAVDSPIVSVAVWALNLETLEQISTRLDALFHDQSIMVTVGTGTEKLRTRRVNEADSTVASSQYAGKMFQFRCSWSTV